MYSLSKLYIEQNGYRYYIPCPLVPYIDEIREKVTLSVKDAILAVALEKGIQLFKKEPIRRQYQYGPAAPVKATTASLSWFILGDLGYGRIFNYDYDAPVPPEMLYNINYTFKPLDARFMYTNTAFTFLYGNYGTNTMTYQKMKTDAPLLYKILDDAISVKYLTDENGTVSYPFTPGYPMRLSCMCVSVNTKKPEHSGYLMNDNEGNILFYPAIHKKLLYLYEPYATESIVFFSNIGCAIDDISSNILYKYTKKKINPVISTPCYRKSA
jgi:hypothetical protein